MPVSLATAKAATLSLHGSVEAVIKNATTHDNNHWSEQKAAAAVAGGKNRCGYYWKSVSKEIWTHNTTGEVKDTRPSGKGKAKKYTRSTHTAYLAVNVNDCWNILSHALKNSGAEDARHVRGNTGTRFVLGIAFPPNFGGETIHQNGPREKCEFIAVVIETSPNVAIVTHFPAATSYFDRKTALN